MTLDEAIEYTEQMIEIGKTYEVSKVVEEYRQLAEWLKELRVFKSRKGRWIRMSALSEQKDDRYKCSPYKAGG